MALPERCPLCGAGRSSQVVVTPHVYGATSGMHAFFHCLECDVRHLFPRLTPEQEARFYAAEFEGFMAGRAGSGGGWTRADEHIRANEPTRLRRLAYLEPHLREARSVLEVGCSSGFMLFPLVADGKQCVGIEPSGLFRQHLQDRGLEAYTSLDDMRKAGARKFDLVMHFFVLEHISSPLGFLKAQLDLLTPGGKIVFEIPNVADPLHSVYDIPAFERFYWSIAHPWYFSENSLRHLLEQLNRPYRILLDQRYDLSNHLIWARDGKPGGMGRFTEALGPDLEESYKRGLIRARKCDTLIGIVSLE